MNSLCERTFLVVHTQILNCCHLTKELTAVLTDSLIYSGYYCMTAVRKQLLTCVFSFTSYLVLSLYLQVCFVCVCVLTNLFINRYPGMVGREFIFVQA